MNPSAQKFPILSFLALFVFIIFQSFSHAGSALPDVVVLKQSNGKSFEAKQRGDEWHNWVETRDGYGIYKNSATGNWEYYQPGKKGKGTRSNGKPAVVGVDDPGQRGIPKGLRPEKISLAQSSGLDSTSSLESGSVTSSSPFNSGGVPVSGAKNVLVIGVDYEDAPATYSPEQVQSLLFGTAGNSVADYYSKTSYSAVSINAATETDGVTDDGFIGWIRLSGNHPNTGASTGVANQQIAKDAILAADPYIDYSQYDTNGNGVIETTELSIIVIVAGYETSYNTASSPSVWAHRWYMDNVGYPIVDGKTIYYYAQFGERHDDHLATIGIIAHELGHLLFDLPDLYDTNSGDGGSAGLGFFDLMASGSWGGVYGTYPGSTPTLLSAWSKEYLGWGVTTTISADSFEGFPKSDGNTDSVFRIDTQDANQYFLIENRQFTGYDQGFQLAAGSTSHGGLVVYHVDKLKTDLWPSSNTVNADETSKGVDVEEANQGMIGYSMLDTEAYYADTGMFFFSGNATDFNDSTVPDSRLKDGTDTGVSLTGVSAYGDYMSANVLVAETVTGGGTDIEDFETGDLTKFPWSTSGDGVWTVTGTNVHGGVYAAEIPVSITHNQSATLELSRSFEEGNVSFWYSVSSELNYDILRFYIDGVAQGEWSGAVPWSQATFAITAGTHTLKWVYSKDDSLDDGSDTAWIDDIQMPAGTSADTTPDPFTFLDQTNVPLSTLVTSNTVTISGIAAPSPITIAGGEYEINNSGAWTVEAGTVINLDTVRVRQTSSAAHGAVTNTVLTIGGVSDTFSVATIAESGGAAESEDFETGDLTKFPWSISGDGSWAVTGTKVHGGIYAAEAPVSILDNQSAALELTRSFDEGTISFWYSVSSEQNFDFLRFYIDGVAQGEWSGSITWTEATFQLTAGIHTLKWVYSKDDSVEEGSDTAWIDDIQMPADVSSDTIPDPFTFLDQTNVSLSTLVTSNTVTISGIAAPSPITITGGEYEINNSGAWTVEAGTVINLDTVRVRQTSSASHGAITDTVLTIGGVSDTFSVTTITESGGAADAEDFETGDLTKFPWSISGDGSWAVTGTKVHGGIYAAEAPVSILDNQSASLELIRSFEEGNVSFWYSVSSEQDFDFLRFYIDGVAQGEWSGSVPWSQATFPMAAGTHTLKWVYSKDGSVEEGSDTAWIDDIDFSYIDMTPDPFTFLDQSNVPMSTLVMSNTITVAGISAPSPISITGGEYEIDSSGVWTSAMGSVNNNSTVTVRQTSSSTPYTTTDTVLTIGGVSDTFSITTENDGTCPDQIVSSIQGSSSMNDLGEIVWSQYDPTTEYYQLYSNQRGQLKSSSAGLESPSINNKGDVVWVENQYIKGLLGGVEIQLSANGSPEAHPSINDNGEVVWAQYDSSTSRTRIYSTLRGYLTNDVDAFLPSINNNGDVVWHEYDAVTGWHQIFGLFNGIKTQITYDAINHYAPSISNSGEVAWSQGRIYKRSVAGEVSQVTHDCPYGTGHYNPNINRCGDMIFTNSESGGGYSLYLLGNNSPCGTEPEPNNDPFSAVAVTSETTTTGVLDAASDTEDWYSFTANAGDAIKVTVNWDTTPPNMLDVALMDSMSSIISYGTGTSPESIEATASYTGTYYVRLTAMNGSFGYAVSLSIVPRPTYALSVTASVAGTGSGRVVSWPEGIDLSIAPPNTMSDTASFSTGTAIMLTATPDSGSTFAGWSGACSGTNPECYLTMDAAKEVTAEFTASEQPATKYAVWADDTLGNNEIFLKRSTDGGANWTFSQLTSNAGNSSAPSVAVDGNNVYVVWQDDTFETGKNEIFLKRSTDGGANWTFTQLTSNAGDSRAPAIAADGNNVYVVWQDDTFETGKNEILMKRSTDGGASWTFTQLTSNAGDSGAPSVAVDGNNVYVVWQDDSFETGKSEILMKRSTDSGATWTFTRMTNNAGDSRAPAIGVSGSNVYVVWQDDTFVPGKSEIFIKRSTDGGATWTFTQVTNNTGDSRAPAIGVSGSNVYVVWQDDTFVPGKSDIFIKRSTDGGATWTFTQMTNNAGDSIAPRVTANGGNVYIGWQDDTLVAGKSEIFMKRSTDGGGTWVITQMTNNAGNSITPVIQ